MKKTKTNISATDSLGRRIKSNLLVGESSYYTSGDVLDANATLELIKKAVDGVIITPGSITSEDIENGSIKLEDLSPEVKNKMTSQYNESEESLRIN